MAPTARTGLTTTTDTAGRWSFALHAPPPQVALVAVAPALRIASPAVGVRSDARLTLGASGSALAGTVAPGQPGRTVDIQRLTVDARGRVPGGRQVCIPPVTAQSCLPDDAWPTVAQAPLDAAGTAFSATASAPGDYRARLAFEIDARGVPTSYGGVSAAVRVP